MKNLSSYSFVIHATSYYQSQSAYKDIKWTQQDKAVFKYLGISVVPPQVQPPLETGRKNLILIYLESFQSNFTELGGSEYKGLTPFLDQFSKKNSYVKNAYNAVTPTINALVSSLCGVIPDVSNYRINKDLEYNKKLFCLSDILHKAGYYQVFMQGSPIEFSGIKELTQIHKYDEVLGFTELSEQTPRYKSRRHIWGLYDSDLVDEVLITLERIKDKKPFHLSFMTVETHTPGFPDPNCPPYRTENAMLNAIHCTDRAIGRLLAALEKKKYLKDTVVMIVGDHVLYPSSRHLKMLSQKTLFTYYGKTFMAFYTPNSFSKIIRTPTYTPDISPTLLELLNFKVNSYFFGQSLISKRKEYPHLLASRFQIINGEQIIQDPQSFFLEECPKTFFSDIKLIIQKRAYSNCERQKILFMFNQKIFGKKGVIFRENRIPGGNN